METYSKFSTTMNRLQINKIPKLAIAVSGGIDSMTLLNLTYDWNSSKEIEIFILSVNHLLREESYEEINLVIEESKKKHLKYKTFLWKKDKESLGNLQSKARDARYTMMTQWCKENNITHLLVAHNQNDNVENFFIRLERGSGIDGLSGIKEVTNINNITIIRPMLNISREEIYSYALKNDIKWLEDKSNKNKKYRRTIFRDMINEQENKQILLDRVSKTMFLIKKEQNSTMHYVRKVAAQCLKITNTGSIKIIKNKLNAFHEETISKLIIYSLMTIGNKCYKPRYTSLNKLMENTLTQNTTKTLHGCILISDENFITINREPRSIDITKNIDKHLTLWDNRLLCKVHCNMQDNYKLNIANEYHLLPKKIRSMYSGATSSLPVIINEENKIVAYPVPKGSVCHNKEYIETSVAPLVHKIQSILCFEEKINFEE